MLEDHKRTGAYYQACVANRRQFAGKVVLDVGTGSGILAIFAAKAGARKVYAVEATSMAAVAKRLVAAQGLEGVVEVIQGVVESIEIPDPVDLIISEWMGYFLLRESMLDSVLVARDRFLRPGGAMYPSHARVLLAAARSPLAAQRGADLAAAMAGWAEFEGDMESFYGVDMSCLAEDFRKENKEYFCGTSAWADVHPSQLLGPPAVARAYDLRTLSLEELKAPLLAKFSVEVAESGAVEAFCGFFDVDFRGGADGPADAPVVLTTAPDPTGSTHWGQQVFALAPPFAAAAGDRIECDFEMRRREDNHRLFAVTIKHRIEGSGKEFRTSRWLIE